MAKADISLPDGTKVKIDGTPDEIAAVVQRFKGKPERPRRAPKAKAQKVQLVDLLANLIDGGFFKKKPKDLASVKAALVAVSAAARARRASDGKAERPSREALDFSLPLRAFMKRHARRLGGPQKFTALLARLTIGEVGVAKSLKEIKNAWNRMTEPM